MADLTETNLDIESDFIDQQDEIINPVSDFGDLKQVKVEEEAEFNQDLDAEEFSFTDKLGAALRKENFVGSYISSEDNLKDINRASWAPEEGYNPFDGDIEGYEGYEQEFTKAFTPEATEAIKRQIDKEQEDNKILESAFMGGAGYSVLAAVTDPSQWALAITTGGMGNYAKGVSTLAKAAQATAAVTGETAITEALLQSTQSSRSALESAFNIGGAAVLGGIVSAGAFKISDSFDAKEALSAVTNETLKHDSKHTFNTDVESFSMEAGDISEHTAVMNQGAANDLEFNIKAKSGGAAAVDQNVNLTNEALSMASQSKAQKAAKAMVDSKANKIISKHSPILRTITSTNINTKNAVVGLAENALIMENNYSGDLVSSLDFAIKKSNLDNINTARNMADVKAEQLKLDGDYEAAVIKAEQDATDAYNPKKSKSTLEQFVTVAKRKVKRVNARLQTSRDLSKEVKEEALKLIKDNLSPKAAVNEAIGNVLAKNGDLGDRAKTIKDSFNLSFDEKFVASQASTQAAETIANKETAMYVNKLSRLEDDYFKKWNELSGKNSNKRNDFNTKAFMVYNLDGSNSDELLGGLGLTADSSEANLLVDYAGQVKKQVMDPLQDDIEEFLPTLWENITDEEGNIIDTNYLHRKYNTQAIADNHDAFKSILVKYIDSSSRIAAENARLKSTDVLNSQLSAQRFVNNLEAQILDTELKIKESPTGKLKNELETELEELNESLLFREENLDKAEQAVKRNAIRGEDLTEEQLSVAAEYTIQKITDNGGILNPSDLMGAGSDDIFKARTIQLPNSAFLASAADNVANVDFINTNLNYSISRAIEGVTLETSIAKAFKDKGKFSFWREANEIEKFGTNEKFIQDEPRHIETIDDIKAYVKSAYVLAIKNGEDLEMIGKQTDQDLKDIDVMYERLRGNRGSYADPASFGAKLSKTFMTIGATAYLGKVTLSSAPDVGRLIIRNGFQESFDAMKVITSKAINGELRNMKKEQLDAFGVAASAWMNKRAQMFGDTKGLYDDSQKWDRMLSKVSNKFFQFTGITHWNDMLQTVASVSSISNAIKLGEDLSKGVKVKEHHLAQARALGVSDDDLKEIYSQWVKAGKESQGSVRFANIEKWDNPEITNKFTNAVHADIKQTVIEPSIGDKPSWYDANPFTKHITQFQSFVSASVTRSMLSGMQTDGIRATQGAIVMLGLAHAMRYVKAYLDDPSGEKAKKIDEEEAYTQIMESIDRSGLLPLLSYFNRYGTPLTGLSLTGSEVGRYSQMSQTRAAIAGPTLGIVERGANIATDLIRAGTGGSDNKTAAEHLNEAGKNASRIAPFSNFYGISYLMNRYREK